MEPENDKKLHCCGSMEWAILLESKEAAEFYRGVGMVAWIAGVVALTWFLYIATR